MPRARRLPVQLLPRARTGAAGRDRQPQRPGARARRTGGWSTTSEWAWVVEHADVDVRAPRAGDVGARSRCPAGCTTSSSGTSWSSEGRGVDRSRRLGETIRRAVDLEDWSAFHDSYVAMMDLLHDVATTRRQRRARAARRRSRSCPATSTSATGRGRRSPNEPDAAGAGEPRPPDRQLADPQRAARPASGG